ncbi:glycogenin-1-like isoform X2 [Teleopsis dalmanni]|uniref:glycogenin-1-like isoform X2 n=1 Tax=Teleopsis dalmanni TaxID=139649 RepID=UPI0018CF9704|nr:glycogenin-1-like isoform X2 [Teleopsis dalmanni]
MSNFAWVTLTTNDTYSLGALVLAHSLKRAGTAHQLAVLVTPGVSESMRNKLKDVYNVVQEVNVLDSQDAANLALLARPELGITFTKLHCWRLVQFEKCVFLDSDTLVLQNCDELFEREELSAAPDVSWPDCFNSGVFVFKPSLDTFAKITEFALKHGSFDGGDQGLLNSYFADWAHTDINKHLPFIYNVTAFASYCYLPAFKQFRDKIKILHFAGKMKPWLVQFNSESRTASAPSDYAHATDLIQLWWNIFCDNVHKTLTDKMNYWRGVLEWNYYKQNYYDQMHFYHHQNNQQHYHNSFFHQQSSDHQHPFYQDHDAQYEYDYVKDFHDPWEDYYDKLDKQMQVESIYEEHKVEESHESHVLQTATVETVPNESHEQHKIEEYNSTPIVELIVEAVNPQNTDWQQQTNASTNSSTNQSRNTDTYSNENSNHSANTANNNIDLVQNLDSNSNCTVNTENIEAQSTQNENEAGLAGALSQLRLGEQRTPEQDAYEALMRRQCWEAGQIDYAGKDSFENIWKKITETLESKPKTETEQQDDKSGSS